MKKLLKKILGPLFSPTSPLYNLYHLSRGWLAATIYGYPGRKLIVVGVTGTNGKTTTSNLIASILETAGLKTGLITTINFWTGTDKKVNETKMTTLNPFAVQRMLAAMVRAGVTHAVVETSSHSLVQHRVYGIPYDVAVFTNLTPEHLDFHKSMQNYAEAKRLLFMGLKPSYSKGVPKSSVINGDDPESSKLASIPADQLVTYSLRDGGGNLLASDIKNRADGSDFIATLPNGINLPVSLHLPGNFNIYNALAAMGAAYALNIPEVAIKQGLEKISVVAGRMETLQQKPFRVVVDYAHTPDGFMQVLSSLKNTTPGHVITVFGAAGDRDKSKRPTLGKIASDYADIIILTEEDPGSEDPLQIIHSIRQGLPSSFTEGQNLFIIPVRTEAIELALKLAQASDTVALLGMGAQTVMARAEGVVPYHEREFVRNLLSTINK